MSRQRAPAVVPASRGYRMPAEWEPHAGTWLAWPHHRRDWPGKLNVITWVFGEMVRRVIPGEEVRILAATRAEEQSARKLLDSIGVDRKKTPFSLIPTNRAWMRDLGPLFIRRESPEPRLAVAGFLFNAWAKYPDWDLDCKVAAKIARSRRVPVLPAWVNGRAAVLEGGSIDVNGRGSVLTTEECLLDPVTQTRNPGAGRPDVEAMLCGWLGVSNVIWLGKGIVGDDTHGHVDDLCRFVGPRTVVLCRETRASDENYRALEENRERLEGARLEDGSRPQVVYLPMPEALTMNGQRLPASYANFYISNAAVIVPTFNDPSDRAALGILAELFPGRSVVGIHCGDLVWGLGTLHCLTQQEPRG